MDSPKTSKTEEQVREEIRGNLMICCDSWSIQNLATLETCASMMGQIGLALHGQEFVGMRKIDQLMFDANGQFKLSDDPKSENSFFKVLASCIEEQKDILAAEEEALKTFGLDSITEPKTPDAPTPPVDAGNKGYEWF
jgi:hypothetical protein